MQGQASARFDAQSLHCRRARALWAFREQNTGRSQGVDETGEVAQVAPTHHLREFPAHRRTDYGFTAGLSSLLSNSSVCGVARPPKRVSISFRISTRGIAIARGYQRLDLPEFAFKLRIDSGSALCKPAGIGLYRFCERIECARQCFGTHDLVIGEVVCLVFHIEHAPVAQRMHAREIPGEAGRVAVARDIDEMRLFLELKKQIFRRQLNCRVPIGSLLAFRIAPRNRSG